MAEITRTWDTEDADCGRMPPDGTRVRVRYGRWTGRHGIAAGTVLVSGGAARQRQVALVDLDATSKAADRRVQVLPTSLEPERVARA